MQKKNLAVFFGGNSYESEVSVISGVLVCNLLKYGYNVIPVYITPEEELLTSKEMFTIEFFRKGELKGCEKLFLAKGGLYTAGRKIKKYAALYCIFNCCHGGWGEDGGLAALAEFCSVPITSPSSAVSGIFMDKYLTKLAVNSIGIPTLPYAMIKDGENAEVSLKYPLIIKPARLGSSIGIQIAESEEELLPALNKAFVYDDKVIAENFCTDKWEADCAAYVKDGKVVLSEVKRRFGKGLYTFEKKYTEEGKAEECTEFSEQISKMTERIYTAFSINGIVRADYIITGGKVYFNELNCVPGSLSLAMFTKRLTLQRDILHDVVEESVCSGKKKKAEVMTGILNNKEIFPSTGCKMR